MGHVPIFDQLRDIIFKLENDSGENAGGLDKPIKRRDFLKQATAAGLALSFPALFAQSAFGAPSKPSAGAPRIAIVGAGLAGLTAAYTLMKAGYIAKVYEASDRVGGRCWTRRGDFADGQLAEHGGELIDNSHLELKQLAQEMGLTLDNLNQAQKNGTEALYYFNGTPYTYKEATRDIKEIWQTLHKDFSDAGYPTLYNSYTARGLELDQMSVLEWINRNVPGGSSSKLGKLLDIAYNIEYGGESSEQSALNLLYLLGYRGQGQLRIFGPSNEKFHIHGGNDQLASALFSRLPEQVSLGHELTAIKLNDNQSYTLTFQTASGNRELIADRVILTVPFSILRSSVDFSKAGFRALKQTAIREQGMGTNAKLHVQFKNRFWEAQGCTGETFADTGYQNTWEVTRAQPGASGILVGYTGGRVGKSYSDLGVVNPFLTQLEPVLPGSTQQWNGKATLDYWSGYQWTRGSYSYWKVGQYTKFSGIEREREGNCFFAGEHTSIDFQGYMNGAVETGQRAAKEILSDLKA
ncbi:flavin monoamine oxidase family protein [Paenibacillus cremeus]|uniref:Twin-arginine translocation signal domain-containing protein n=1 Tax=Paenibacillus cremeus TaxID=2163881 RepID=A0A559KAS1_9BACL|nr:NAD(P)/FAD-dependent oxidoreductase [Paenibacillus cremeus]TVY09199.1 twin-arginine translocation signal domain-containing protein [Paenibacillus cremeus]